VKLKKMEIVDESVILAMSRDELVDTIKRLQERLGTYQDRLFRARQQRFGAKSEKSKSDNPAENKPFGPPKPRGKTTKLPSERYPDATIREEEINFSEPPACSCCGSAMRDSGMTEDSEYLDVESKEFIVVQQRRHKHRCPNCHGGIATAPVPPRITPGGSYSDALIVDAALSKYCDLIPVERYGQMAARAGLSGLPPHSLIKAIFRLADLFGGLYNLIKDEVLRSVLLLADETPHRMLEGDEKQRWYLWGFSTPTACFFECHNTRSGDVSSEVLKLSKCLVLLSDAYSGYSKSVRVTNKLRLEQGLAVILIAYCNAHARRQFFPGQKDNAKNVSEDAKFMISQYKEIYKLEDEAKGLSDEEVLKKRAAMKPYFEAMKTEALVKKDTYSNQSEMNRAYNYFLKYYDGLTLFLSNIYVPIDNNSSERLLRSPVIGRKTWYGTHSPRGAEAAAVHFTVVEACKLNKVNPRRYYMDMLARIHGKQDLMTPSEYKKLSTGNTG
jgi:transposase